jgi:hypothetical protein
VIGPVSSAVHHAPEEESMARYPNISHLSLISAAINLDRQLSERA